MGKAADPKTKHVIGSMTDLMRRFAMEYTIDFSGTNAAIRAGCPERSANATASKYLARPDVQDLIQKRMARIERKTEISSEVVLTTAFGIATADVNDLVEFRRRCCRHCYGIDYGYQRTKSEMSNDRAVYENTKRRAISKDPRIADAYEAFDEQGGIGYDARKPPVADCEHCWGDGIGDAFFKPTANLSPEARALYAGVKQTKDGYQMMLVDKLGALEKLFKHKGLYKADNKQQADALSALMAAIGARGGKLPIKES
jgi:phage terminase small subunit